MSKYTVKFGNVEVTSPRPVETEGIKNFKKDKIYKVHSKKKLISTEFRRVNLEEEFKKRMKDNKTFLINNPTYLKGDIRTKNGIFSPLFGPDIMNPDAHEYMCDCAYLIGAPNEGETCPKCGTKVQHITTDLTKCAFIDISPHKVLTYSGWYSMVKLDKGFTDIVKRVKKIEVSGRIIEDDTLDIIDIEEKYRDKYEKHTGVPYEQAFTSLIPVINANTRPLGFNDSRLTLFKINKDLNTIVNSLLNLKIAKIVNKRNEIVSLLNTIQESLVNIYEEMDMRLKGKKGDFRIFYTTAKLDYNARMVVTSGIGLKPYEIDVPFQTIAIVFEEEMVRTLRIMGYSAKEAIHMLRRYLNKPKKAMIKAANLLIKENLWILIGRNPTIKYGSIQYMKVRSLNKSIRDFTMKIPQSILPATAGDYDGDQYNTVASKLALDGSDLSYHELFKYVFCPTYQMIDRSTGKFNRAFSFKKDHSVILSSLWNVSEYLKEYQEDPEYAMEKYEFIRHLVDMESVPYERIIDELGEEDRGKFYSAMVNNTFNLEDTMYLDLDERDEEDE
jgi:DNA-directed RNA polymerase beta' subunit